ncbi:lysozyme inhibitor LprI family protein [Paracoccus sp. (in: a-proteobacteria)]|uniref:lysozyme inhibitor LprI family protein n=1 Tax=Paracoccus sp. TaxID=267 RepID=UPI0026DEC28D|nr:lysozyme inhibitor LprI family protein [Paracoccus sp. (in: a-proteobacteria)]MDO5370692.1 lysozyme inhibitor LprI family protein [Paracoccus sp. (in: a-proteobacteria)]
MIRWQITQAGRRPAPLLCAVLVALSCGVVAPAMAMPADQAKVDAGAMDACVAAAADVAAAGACIVSQQAACVARLKEIYKDVGPVDGRGPCLGAEGDYWDGRLNDGYTRLMAAAEGDGADSLRQAERAWIAFRDALCAYEALVLADRPEDNLAGAACLVRETAAQSLRIDGYLAERIR